MSTEIMPAANQCGSPAGEGPPNQARLENQRRPRFSLNFSKFMVTDIVSSLPWMKEKI